VVVVEGAGAAASETLRRYEDFCNLEGRYPSSAEREVIAGEL
jgi:hypothetical protein